MTIWRKIRGVLPRYRKALAAMWGTLTTPMVVGVLDLAGIHVDTATATWLIGVGAVILGPAAAALAKPNAPKEPPH